MSISLSLSLCLSLTVFVCGHFVFSNISGNALVLPHKRSTADMIYLLKAGIEESG